MAWTDLVTRAVGYTVTAANWNALVGNFDQLQTWTNFTPTLKAVTTDPTLSDNASHIAAGHYWTVGDGTSHGLLIAKVHIKFGTSGTAAGSGIYSIEGLPINIAIGNLTQPIVAHGFNVNGGTGVRRLTVGYANSATSIRLVDQNDATLLTEANPWGWSDSYEIKLDLAYRI